MLILIAAGSLVVVACLSAAMLPARYIVARDIIVNRPRAQVFGYLRLLRNQDNFNKWIMSATDMKREFRGTDGTVGFVYAWEGKRAGKGEQEIVRIEEGDTVETELRFVKPFRDVAQVQLITEFISPEETRVVWTFSGKRNFGMKLMHRILNMRKMMSRDLDTGLITLKKELENQ